MNYPSYPSPCDSCEVTGRCTATYDGKAGCAEYRKWFLWWWKYFSKNFWKYPIANIKITKEGSKDEELPEPVKPIYRIEREKFRYEHPDRLAELRKNKPCDTCHADDCDTPCKDYEAWFAAKWDYDRKRVCG